MEPSARNAALQAGDWLTQVKPLIADTSIKAGAWWDQLLDCTMKQYGRWLEANPLDRLKILPPMESEHERLEQRITNMLLAAMKSELIATRQLTPQGILFKVLRVYQAGGLGERSTILTALHEDQGSHYTPQEAVEHLRLWHPQLLRTGELKAALPDATLLIGALDQIVRKVLSTEAQATFRINTFRIRNSVDVRPTTESVHQFYKVLLAEAETMVGSALVEAVEPPAIKLLQNGTPTKTGGGKICAWWGTDAGCRYGKNCRQIHTVLEDRVSRCCNCSSTAHRIQHGQFYPSINAKQSGP